MKKTIFILILITAIGTILRITNISPFKIYPDTYQSLVVAQNLKNFHSVVGTLGKDGMVYPDFFMWSRPGFPLLINLGEGICNAFELSPPPGGNFKCDEAAVAQFLVLSFSITSIPLAFFLIRSVFKSKKISRVSNLINRKPINSKQKTDNRKQITEIDVLGFSASLLLSLSFNHTVWSGFIMTETSGVFFMLLFLWSLFAGVYRKTKLFDLRDLITGVLFSAAVLTRYEYVIILPSILILTKPSVRFFNILSSFSSVIFVTALLFFPFPSTIYVILDQSKDLILRAGIVLSLLLLGILFLRKFQNLFKSPSIPSIPSIPTLSQPLILLIPLILFFTVPFFHNFATHDFLIFLAALFGIVMMFQGDLRDKAIFVIISCLSLGFIYQRINPEMDRYMTHLIPFLLIPAAYGLVAVIRRLKTEDRKQKSEDKSILFWFLGSSPRTSTRLLIIFLIVLQVYVSLRGIRFTSDPSWFRTSYEEKAANMIQKDLKGDEILISSLPEPYFYFTGHSTQSIADKPPFVYISENLNKKSVLIINDEGMRRIFPNFSKFLSQNLGKYKVGSFKINEKFHIENHVFNESNPVGIYRLKLSDLNVYINCNDRDTLCKQ